MSKNFKIGLLISSAVVFIIALSIGRNVVRNNLSTATDSSSYGEVSLDRDMMMYDSVEETHGLATVQEAGFSGSQMKMTVGNTVFASSASGAVNIQAQDRLIIKTANISMVVKDVREAIKKISEYTNAKSGFIVSSDVNKSGVLLSGSITVRIPAGSFDTGIEEVKTYGEVVSERMDGQDVTEEFVDLDAQLTNLRATETQFLNIMKQAFKIEDILAVQRELSNVRSNIDRIEGRMKYLQQSADLSTLTVYLSTDPSVLPVLDTDSKWKPWGVVKDSVRDLVDQLQYMVEWIIWFVVYIPVILIYLLVIWIVYKIGNAVVRHYKK